jgi:mycothiol synthase
MSDSLTLSVSSPDEAREPFLRLVARAALVDGQHPFNDQALVDAGKGTRSLLLAERGGAVVGAAVVGQGELEFVVDPEWREEGVGGRFLDILLVNRGIDASLPLLAWAHGDHPASRKLAASRGFEAVRTLLQLRRTLEGPGSVPPSPAPPGYLVEPFRGGRDIEDWVELNARVFAAHPEQGSLTADDLRFRMSEPWFDPDDFLLLRDSSGALVGYNWLKVESGDEAGEIYVVGVDEANAGQGLGRLLMNRGLARLAERGRSQAALYVDGENTRAVALYRSLGFTDHTIDIQYRRRPGRRR